MKTGEIFPSKWVKKEDVKHPVIAIIEDVRLEPVKGEHGEEEKAVMYFERDKLKPFILNRGNMETIESAYGDETDDWRGKPVELYEDPGVMYGPKRVGGVRVRIPSGAAKTATPPVDDSIWGFSKAVAECEIVGITKDAMVAKLKELGKTGYIASRDTLAVKEMIARVQNGDAASGDLESIPF